MDGVNSKTNSENLNKINSAKKMSTDNKSAAIGGYKEYLLIDRKDIEELRETAINLLKDADNDTSKYYEAMAIIDTIKYLKERNIYNREFKYKS